MTESDYQKLNEHLEAKARPIFKAFVERHGLKVPSEGRRYPLLRGELTRPDGLEVIVDFSMEVDDRGKHYTTFKDDLPYELSGGVTLDRDEEDGLVRYGKFKVIYGRRPFKLAIKTLEKDLEELWSAIAGWTAADALTGRRTVARKRR